MVRGFVHDNMGRLIGTTTSAVQSRKHVYSRVRSSSSGISSELSLKTWVSTMAMTVAAMVSPPNRFLGPICFSHFFDSWKQHRSGASFV